MTRSVNTHAARILLWLYIVQAAVGLVLVGIYKAPVYNWTLLYTKAGILLIVGALSLFASGRLVVLQVNASAPWRGRAFAIALMTNVLTVLIIFLVLEATIRVVARRTAQGIAVGSVVLRATWPELVTESRQVLAGATRLGTWDRTYFIYDRELGWTVGPNRQSPDGLYFSSVEGIRSAGPNVRMAAQTPRFRVALVGDSNAFSFEVPFEESWGYYLQRFLGDDVQVLNFGVDGYGIDQMYLRYQRDVRPWKPQVVVVGFIEHDLWRTMAVYPIVSFGWRGYLVKPRFTIEHGNLELLNVPLPLPEEILTTARVQQLPFIDYDWGYGTTDWAWRFDRAPFALRLLTSAFPRSTVENPQMTEEATIELNSRLFAQIVESVEKAGAIPLVVSMSRVKRELEQKTLGRAGVPFLGVTECLTAVPTDKRRVPSGWHYTGVANEAIAKCTALRVKLALERSQDSVHRLATLRR